MRRRSGVRFFRSVVFSQLDFSFVVCVVVLSSIVLGIIFQLQSLISVCAEVIWAQSLQERQQK